MARNQAYNSTVAARTRAAAQMLDTPELLAKYVKKGGLSRDLEAIKANGLRAEVLNQAQSKAQADGGAATVKVLTSFVGLQKDYSGVMSVVQAVKFDLEEAAEPAELVAAVAKILVNEAEVTIREIKKQAAEAPPGEKPKRAAIRSQSQEALRAEIQKDAAALVDLKAIHKRLAERQVDLPQLKKLRDDAMALSGHLADRVVKKGAAKSATQSEAAAVAQQKATWGACYRILAAVGREDPRIAQLLGDAAITRPPTEAQKLAKAAAKAAKKAKKKVKKV